MCLVAEQAALIGQRDATIAAQAALIERLAGQVEWLAARVEVLERQVGKDSGTSSRPPSSDSPFTKKAPQRSSRTSSGRPRGKQPGEPGQTRNMVTDPDEIVVVDPPACTGCGGSLADASVFATRRHQVFDVPPPPPRPYVTEYRIVARVCPCCAATSAGQAPVGVTGRVGYGPGLLARAAWLVCAHHLPVRRAAAILAALAGARVSSGWVATVRGRAARLLATTFLPRVKELIAAAPVAHADETTARADGALRYLHVACTDYLTVMHVGDRTAATIDAGGVWPAFTGTLVRDGYTGYAHLTGALHAWCGAHLLRDLRAVHDGDPAGQVWADAMADVLLDAHHAAGAARHAGQAVLAPEVLARIRNHYLGALARGDVDNQGTHSPLATDARTLIRRFRRYENMILRFATDLTVPFSNNLAERDVRPVKVQQRTSGGCWRTLHGLADFAVVQSYLSTASKWGLDTLDALTQLFTTGPWLPPTAQPG
ncbi:IS66 family transposase [Frankia sp. Ag45/Mut15]|uniref:IS66 family transposase n=1 Tax=Frankia umida TaxID=573489 RepID=A0ABT0K5S5_9ACTN|nr:IS66 family transposase [Frankia umida]MCK9879133.1 IS66 family transposase [Frankia umida]